jgi:hypothetical protein
MRARVERREVAFLSKAGGRQKRRGKEGKRLTVKNGRKQNGRLGEEGERVGIT